MKKRFVLMMLAVIAASALALALVGCESATSVDYAGKYPLSKATAQAGTLEGSDLADAGLSPSENYIEIKDSKNITFVLGGDTIETTYSLDGKTLHVKDGSSTLDFTLEGNTLSYYEPTSKATLYFTKG
jgi:hypothetical protein